MMQDDRVHRCLVMQRCEGQHALPRVGMDADATVDTQRLGPEMRVRGVGAAAAAWGSPVILVADDDPLNRTVMSAILKRLGYRFHLATNGREAVEAVLGDSYAAVLMDCLMPEMDGYEATVAIRRHEHEHQEPGAERRLPIIAVTAVAIKGARERCIEAGMDDYMSKPVTVQS